MNFVMSFAVVAILTGCSLLPTGQTRNPPTALSGATPTPIPTPIVPTKPVYTVQRGDVEQVVQFGGRVAPIVEEELFFSISGRVRGIYFKRNDFVKAGQVIADLEIDDLERELASAVLDLERAQQELTEAELAHADQLSRAKLEQFRSQAEWTKEETDRLNELDKARVELAKKDLELARAQSEDPSPERIKAEAALAEARIAVKRAQQEYDKIAFADDLGTSSQAEELQQATLDLEQAQADYELAIQEIAGHDYELALLTQEVALAQLQLQRLQDPKLHDDLRAEVELAQLEVSILERGVDPLFKNNVQRNQLNVEKLEAAIADGQVIAPFDGQILSISLTEGREAVAYKPVVILADVSALEITADLRESQLTDLEENMPATITLSSRPGEEFQGSIRRLPYPYGGGGRSDGVEEEDKSTRLGVEQTLEELGLELGDLVRVEVMVKRSENVLWLPPQAIRTFDGRKFVVVQDGELQRRVDVKVGVEGEDRVEIEEGLTEGQIVLGL
jgi:multidrug efflux pump subunit AcrA (membrane-fusion protein)